MGRLTSPPPAPGLRRALEIVTRRGAARPLLVGELNPHSDEPRHALYPTPGTSGDRLCRMILGMTPRTYLAAFGRVNLVRGEAWDDAEARREALRLWHHEPIDRQVILLGRKVHGTFSFVADCAGAWEPFVARGRFLCLPHPSGLWDDPAAIDSAMLAVLKFCPQVYEVIT